jgi:hypothetical protein
MQGVIEGAAHEKARPAGDALAVALYDLGSPSYMTRREAVDRIAATPVDPARQAEVAQALGARLADEDESVRDAAIAAGLVWKATGAVEAGLARLASYKGGDGRKLVDALAGSGEPRAAEALASLLGNQESDASPYLTSGLERMGAVAEPAVLARLGSLKAYGLAQALGVLAKVGTEASVPALRGLADGGDGGAQMTLGEMARRGVRIEGP